MGGWGGGNLVDTNKTTTGRLLKERWNFTEIWFQNFMTELDSQDGSMTLAFPFRWLFDRSFEKKHVKVGSTDSSPKTFPIGQKKLRMPCSSLTSLFSGISVFF